MSESTTAKYVARVNRTINAPRERVFKAWTNPETLMKWWGAGPDYHAGVAEVDLRVGGRYRLAMVHTEKNITHTVGGEYKEIDPPNKLAYTWKWETEEEGGDLETLVTVEFKDAGDQTEVVLVHEQFPTEELRDNHAQGWAGCMANLAGAVE